MPCIALGVAPGQIKNFVTFGDSYTDTSYYPTADGGYQWPTWAAEYGPFNLYGKFFSSTERRSAHSRSIAYSANQHCCKTRVRKVRRNLLQPAHVPSVPAHHGVADPCVLERDVQWDACAQCTGNDVHDLDRDQRSRCQRALDGERHAWRVDRPREAMRHRRLETSLRDRRAPLYHAKRTSILAKVAFRLSKTLYFRDGVLI